MPTIHHPELKRQSKVGAGFARALIRDGGWKDGPLPESKTTDGDSETASDEAKKTAKKAAKKS